MQSGPQTAPVSTTRLWAGRIMTALAVLFLLLCRLAGLGRAVPARRAAAGTDSSAKLTDLGTNEPLKAT